MSRAAFALAAALLLPAAAGCLAPNDAPRVVPGVCDARVSSCDDLLDDFDGTQDQNVSLFAAPVWQVGDWWRYKVTGGTTSTLVVASAGNAYEVRPTDNATALIEAVYDISVIGAIGLDLSGDTAEGRVKFLDFPLEDNKTWNLLIDGMSLRAMAKLDKTVWRITASDGNQTMLTYTYDPVARWFSSLRWDYLDISLTLDAYGSEYDGHVYTTQLQPRWSYATGAVPVTTFNVDSGASAVAVVYGYEGSQGFAASARFVDPAGNARAPFADTTCSAPCGGGDIAVFPAVPGGWSGTVESAGQGRLTLDVYQVTDQRRAVR